MDEAELRYRAETIGASMLPTHALCVFGWLYVALTWSDPHRPFLAALFAAGVVSQVILARLPIDRVRARPPAPRHATAPGPTRFKQVNDRFGHVAGDDALRGVAEALRSVVRPDDLCGRMGGDEFMVALPGTGPAAAERVAVSLGVAVFPDHATDRDDLMRRADVAMYSAKQRGRARAATFEPGVLEPLA